MHTLSVCKLAFSPKCQPTNLECMHFFDSKRGSLQTLCYAYAKSVFVKELFSIHFYNALLIVHDDFLVILGRLGLRGLGSSELFSAIFGCFLLFRAVLAYIMQYFVVFWAVLGYGSGLFPLVILSYVWTVFGLSDINFHW